MKCIPARRFSCVLASYATPCAACCACISAPTTTPTVATRMAMDTISSINVNPFCRFIPWLLARLELRNISLELILARKFSGRIVDRYNYVSNVVSRFAREVRYCDRACEICQRSLNIVRGAKLSVRSGIHDESGCGAYVVDGAHQPIGARHQQRLRPCEKQPAGISAGVVGNLRKRRVGGVLRREDCFGGFFRFLLG